MGRPILQTSLSMAQGAASRRRDGIWSALPTPATAYPYRLQIIEERFAELREDLKDVVQLSLGATST